jgi:hypothetical protein
MKQLTDEIRLQIFQLNIRCEVVIRGLNNSRKFKIIGCIEQYVSIVDTNKLQSTFEFDELTLLKRPLSSITDEEAIEMFKYMGLYGEVMGRDKDCVHFLTNDDETSIRLWFDGEILSDNDLQGNGWPIYLSAYQYLHSIGMALPYLDWSVEELIKENVYKIINT